VSRKKGSDSFSFKNQKPLDSFKPISNIVGADNKSQLINALPFKRRFRPAVGTKNFSILSDYNYASLWVRWRRGYELSVYAQGAYSGLVYSSFKYYVSGTEGVGGYIPGLFFVYPTRRADTRMHMVGIRPRDTFNFLDFGITIQSVTQHNATTYAVVLSQRFGSPISFFAGEVLSNRFRNDGSEKKFGYNNYTVVAVGLDGVITTPSLNPNFNTLFLSFSEDASWSVVDANTIVVPATGPPLAGEFLSTEIRVQCSCQDFLSRESFNFYNLSLKQKYPYTQVLNIDPGFFDAGPDAPTRQVSSADYPGYVRSFGFIYLNKIYTEPLYTDTANYSDPNLFYFQPRWCKHIYASFWDMQRRFNLFDVTSSRLPQPNDEPMNEYYREKFEIDLKKQMSDLKLEEDLVWWQRYSPSLGGLSKHLLYSDKYNMIAKTLNFGQLNDFSELQDTNFELFTIETFNPLNPSALPQDIYDGGTYANGVIITGFSNSIDGGQYNNSNLVPSFSPLSFINGGTY
jgi:hypothetical protein